jgi:diguanylate cyclase (GGDEF)-like protein/PAS domain S-box-containing protein
MVQCQGRVEVDEQGEPVKMLGTAQDVTAAKLAEERFRSLFETAPYAIAIVDDGGRIVLVNSQAERLFGYTRAELLGVAAEALVPTSTSALRPWYREPIGLSPAIRGELDLCARRKDGSTFPVEISLSPLLTEDGTLVSAAIRDVTERKLAADALAHQATHDPLTGLPNRTLLLDRLDHALARARRSGAKLAVVFLDLDDFKLVNDTLGHDVGDLLLVALTPRLSATLRPGDTIARFGGDEFVVLCEELEADPDAIHIAERITQACSRPVLIGDQEHIVTVSAGVVIVEAGAATPTDVLRDADAAMYRAKAIGTGRVEVFDEGMRARLTERIAIESELRRALVHDELRIFYQPVVSLPYSEVVGVEALLRWEHPVRGLLEPAEFMHIAESTGLIVPIGEWVLEQACRQAVTWQAARGEGKVPIRMSVNLSPRQVARSDVGASVARILRSTGLAAELLDLEISEGSLHEEGEASGQTLRELKDVGVRLVLDDFGTGYASLGHLKRFTIDALKIDRSFVDGLGRDTEDSAIVGAVLSMARALDVGVTAEGVETSDQLRRLREQGCDFAQGYLFSRPAPAGELAELLDVGGARERLPA